VECGKGFPYQGLLPLPGFFFENLDLEYSTCGALWALFFQKKIVIAGVGLNAI